MPVTQLDPKHRWLAAFCLAAAVAMPAVTSGATPAGAAAAPTSSLAGFKAHSISWISAQQGWVAGTRACANALCTEVLGTTDGGTTWTLAGTVPAPLATPGNPGITEIRFADRKYGWAFAPGLLYTSDGGHHWSKSAIPGGATQVVSLVAEPGESYAVVSPCKGSPYCSKPLSMWKSQTQKPTSWTHVSVTLKSGVSADLAASGASIYVAESQRDITGKPDLFFASTDGGQHFSSRPVPCDSQPDIALIQAVAVTARKVDLLCDGNPGFSKAVKFVYRSIDTGKTDTYAGTMGLFGIQARLAVSPSDNLAVASQSDGSFIYVNDTHKRAWTMTVGLGDLGVGWNDITYVSDNVAWVVYGPADFSDIGQLWVTRDAGNHWTDVGGGLS